MFYDGGWHTVPSGSSITRYATANEAGGDPCECGGCLGGCQNVDSGTCVNGVVSGSSTITYTKTSCSCHCTHLCFIGETTITLADGSTKRIDDLEVGDAVRGQLGINHVVATTDHSTDQTIYGFNGGKPFVTGGHPFWTKQGWKAIDPRLTPTERHNVKTTKLKVGDVLKLDTGEKMVIRSIDADDSGKTQQVYSPAMDGDHTYYANGLLVHNKLAVCP